MANSLTVSNKAETGPQNYNMRVVECRLAAIVLAIALGQAPAEARAIRTLKQLEPRIAETLGGPKGEVGPEALVGVVREHLHEQPYSQEEVEGIIGQPLDKLLEGNASQLRVLAVAAQRGGFKLRQRAEHVYSEAARPDQFAAVCARGGDVQQTLAELGRLMDESQASCRLLCLSCYCCWILVNQCAVVIMGECDTGTCTSAAVRSWTSWYRWPRVQVHWGLA